MVDVAMSSRDGVGDIEASLLRLELVARVMDSSFVLPGTTVRFGLDAIIGLVPVVGDAISGAISSYLIWEARKLGVPKWIIGRMMTNTLIDTALGSVPILGDAFDVAYRANTKNMALLRRHLHKSGAIARVEPPRV